MSFFFSTLFPFVVTVMVLGLLFTLFRFIYREKYAESIRHGLLKLPAENRTRFLSYEKRTARLLKISIWPALLLLVLLPVAVFQLYRHYFLAAIVYMTLGLAYLLQEYRYRAWLIEYLEAREIQQ